MSQPYFIDKLDVLVDEFYDQFENEMGEYLFVFLTEAQGRHKRTMIEAAEDVNCAVRGLDMQKLVDEEYEHYSYDDGFQDSQQLSAEIMTRLLRKYAENY